MLPCDHIYNQWIFIDDSSENLARFEKTAKEHAVAFTLQPE